MDIYENILQYLQSICSEVVCDLHCIVAFKGQYKIEYYKNIKKLYIYDLDTGYLIKRCIFS